MRAALCAQLATLALLSVPAEAADNLDKLKDKLARQQDPADRAKTTVKIGTLLLDQTARAFAELRYEAGKAVLEEYLGYVRRAYQDLEASGRNARKKPKGFKDLEIHLRKAALRLDDVARSVPYEERAPIEAAREEIENIWDNLIRALFGLKPRPPGGSPPEGTQEKIR
jgi:hypothetical protein